MEHEYTWLKKYPNFHIEFRDDGFVAIKYYNLSYRVYKKDICDEKFLKQEVNSLNKKIMKNLN